MANLKVYLSGILVRIEFASTPTTTYFYEPSLLRYEAIYVPALLKYVIYIYAQRIVNGDIIQEVVNGAPFDEIADSSNTPYSLADYTVVLVALQSLGIVVTSEPATEATLLAIIESMGNKTDTAASDSTSAWSLVALLKGCWFYLKSVFGRQTDGTQKSQLYGAAKGTTTAGEITGTNASADRQLLDVILRDAAGAVVTIPTPAANAQYTNASTQATPTGTVALGWDGTNVRALSTNNAGRLNTNIESWLGSAAPTVGQKTKTSSIPVVLASDQDTITIKTNKSATYSATIVSLAAVALAATDIFTITGSATKTVKIQSIKITGKVALAVLADIVLLKRSTANTGGISSAPTRVPHDSTNAAATATVLAYNTTNPTLGTLVGNIRAKKVLLGLVSEVPQEIEWNFGIGENAQTIFLRGINEVLAINLNGLSLTTPVFDIAIEWTEE